MITAGKNLYTTSDYAQFEKLINKSILVLNDRNQEEPFIQDKVAWSLFENATFDALTTIQRQNRSEPFSNWNIELVSGGKFPDITAEIMEKKKFGIEVKTSRAQNWKTLGGSIMESTRIEDVDRINVLFAKLKPFEVRTMKFEDCVSGVSVTHSPRYLIDFNIDPSDSIFNQIGIPYDVVRVQEKPFNCFRDYFREKARQSNTDLWYLADDTGGEEVEDFPSLDIKFFSDLHPEEKRRLIARAFLLFPEVLAKTANYKKISLWLLKMGILNNSLRDMFSANSNVDVHGYMLPSKFERLRIYYNDIVNDILSGETFPIDVQDRYPELSKSEILAQWKIEIFENIESYKGGKFDPGVFKSCEKILEKI